MKPEIPNSTVDPLGTAAKPLIRSRLRRLRSQWEQPLTPHSLAFAAIFHVAFITGFGFFITADSSLASDTGDRLVMSFANFERRSEQGFSSEIDEPIVEVDDALLEEELAELSWVVEPITQSLAEEPTSNPNDSPTETFDWPIMPSRLHPQMKRVEPAPPEPETQTAFEQPTSEVEELAAAAGEAPVADVQPILLQAVPPRYPAIARRKGWEGSTTCLIRVGAKGAVLAVEIESSSGFEILDRAAIDAVSAWHFTPGLRRGVADEFEVSHKITFRLES